MHPTNRLSRCLHGILPILALCAGLTAGPARAWTTDPYAWSKVATGGGGEIPALVIHPRVQDVMYIGADVGGLDRWDPVGQQWIPTLDFMRTTDNNDNNFGVTGIAVDPNDATGNIVYAAVGIYDWWNGEVLKSTDRGNTWIRNSIGMFPFNSNGDQGHTQRLVVDPANSNVLYVAARDGLYRSTDAATTWTKLTSAPTGDMTNLHSGGGACGDEMVIIDQTSGTVTGPTRSKRIFLAPLGSALYKSEDGGTTWGAMSGAPTSVGHAAINSSGVMYVTNGSGVYKYTGGASGTWSTISPAGSANYMTIALDPFNNNNIITIKDTGGGTNPIYRSTDGGATWPYTGANTVTPVPSWLGGMGIYMFMAAFDPFRQGTVWTTDDASPFKTTNIMASNVAWTGYTKGHEETVEMPAIISPPSGPTLLYYGVADFGAFANTTLSGWPNRIVISATPGGANGSWPWLDMTGVDFEEANPNFVAFVGCEGWSGPRGGGAYTTDGGVTYHQFATYPTNFGGRIAVSASSQAMVWAPSSQNPAARYAPSYSSDTGATWHACSGAPGLNFGYNIFNYNSPLCSDRKNGAKFYIYNDNGTFYRSTDTGHTFTQVASGLPGDSRCNLIANPYVEGDLWLSLHGSGLYHSTDSGSTWTHLANVQNAYMVTAGKGPNATTASIYIMGMVDGDTNEGVFRSDSQGASWLKVDIARPYPGDSPNFMAGDRRTYGTVYVGTSVGVYYGQRGSAAPAAPTGLAATAGNAQVALSWTASTGATSYNVKRSTVNGSGYATISSPAGTSYTNTGLTNGTTYHYVVTAVNASGESGNSNQASATPTAPAPQAQIASGTATVDGTVDAAWNNATSYSLTKTTGTISGASDCSATWKGMWDSTNLYVLVDVTDDIKNNDSTAVWDDDSVELYLDADHNGGTVYDANDRQVGFGWGDAAPVEGAGRSITGVTFAKADPTTTTYRIEAKFPWSVEAFTPAANAIIGVDIHVNDDDDGAARDGKVIFNDGTDQAWTNPSLFGTGKLNGATTPPVPTGLAATAGNAQIALSWNASTGATGYNVKRSTTSGSGYATISSPTTTSYTNTGLTNGTTYYYVVSAVNANGESANSSQASATPVAPPAAPTGLAAVPGIAQAWLTWTASTGATTYNVKRSTVSGSGYATVGNPATVYFMNTGLTNGTTYYYVVTAVNAGGESANSSQVSAAPSATVPQAQIPSGTATIDGTVEAAWNSATSYLLSKTSGTIGSYSDCTATFKALWDTTNLYLLADVTDDVKNNDSATVWDDDSVELYLDADHNGGTTYDANDRQVGFGWGDAAAVEGAARSITGVTFAKADPNGISYRIEAKFPWSVEAFTPVSNAIVGMEVMVNDDDDGAARDGKAIWNDATDQSWTNPSLFGSGKLIGGASPPAAPTGLAGVPTDTQIALTWNASTGATSYNVYRGTTAGGESATAIATGIAGTSYTNTGLTDGVNYFYTVKAVNANGTSGASNETSGVPAQYNFESGVQTWSFYNGAGTGVAQSTTQAFGRTHSLAFTINGAAGDTFAYVNTPGVPSAGKTITAHVWLPAGAPLNGIALYVQDNVWAWTSTWIPIGSLTLGAWNTVTYTIPAGTPMPLQRLGVQIQTNATWNSTVYIDSVSW